MGRLHFVLRQKIGPNYVEIKSRNIQGIFWIFQVQDVESDQKARHEDSQGQKAF